jgi:hypothetical protein
MRTKPVGGNTFCWDTHAQLQLYAGCAHMGGVQAVCGGFPALVHAAKALRAST